jgi:DNA (cytosine-5)-methyltransferase 1
MLEVVDLFCGAGGLSWGLRRGGLTVRAGIDLSPACIATYRRNLPRVEGVVGDLCSLSRQDILEFVSSPDNLVLAGCPPCRLFSQLHRRRKPLGDEFGAYLRLLWSLRPKYVVFENVPRIVDRVDAWGALTARLKQLGYFSCSEVVTADHFGVPQRRRRLVLVAARAPITLPKPPEAAPRTVREAIGHLPERDETIPNHITMNLSLANQARMRKTGRDGGRSKPHHVPFDDSYGRMEWDRPAPTITTRCISFSNGRFGHPEYNRAITVREAALLQGFPEYFVFEGGIKETARQVGNAVPPPLAAWLAQIIITHFNSTKAIQQKQ